MAIYSHLIQMEIDWDQEEMRRWSKTVFRNDHRLEVAVLAQAADQESELYPQAIADALELHQAEVRKHFQDLVRAGLLERTDKKAPTAGRRGSAGKLYARTEDDFWQCLSELGERFRRSPPKTKK